MQIVDMHCDTISRLLHEPSKSLRENDLHLDLHKMRKGDYLLQNFAMFVMLGRAENPMYECQRLIAKYYEQIEANSDMIAPVYTYADIEKNMADNKMSAMLTLEEGAVVNNDITLLRIYHKLGVRMITLTWNFANGIGHPNFSNDLELDRFDKLRQTNTVDGLTDFGIEYIKEMERLGIIIDVSHLGDAGFYDVVKYSTKPFVASHSNARSVCGVARNLTDDMILKIAQKGGVIGLNYCEDFLSDDGKGSIDKIVEHAKHIIDVGGTEVLGLGSDFDGIGNRSDLSDGSHMPELVEALSKTYGPEVVDKITHDNVLRIYREVLR